MAIEIRETFEVQAPVEAVWAFLLDPQRVSSCMPGAALDEVVDERTFLGTIRVKVGAVTTSYKGRVQLTGVDEAARTVSMVAEGRETGGGTARGTMSSRLRSLEDGRTEVAAEASVDLTGRVMQVGRGMIQGVSHQLFLQFVASARERLESPEGADQGEPRETEPIRIVPLLLRVVWSGIAGFFRRLFRWLLRRPRD